MNCKIKKRQESLPNRYRCLSQFLESEAKILPSKESSLPTSLALWVFLTLPSGFGNFPTKEDLSISSLLAHRVHFAITSLEPSSKRRFGGHRRYFLGGYLINIWSSFKYFTDPDMPPAVNCLLHRTPKMAREKIKETLDLGGYSSLFFTLTHPRPCN